MGWQVNSPRFTGRPSYGKAPTVVCCSEPTKNGSLTSPPMTGRSPLATPTGQRWGTGLPTTAPPAEDKSALTVAALGVIIFIAILLAVVIVLVSVVSLRFRCRRCKEAEDKQKPQHPVISFSYSDADTAANRKSVLLLSMKELSDSNSECRGRNSPTRLLAPAQVFAGGTGPPSLEPAESMALGEGPKARSPTLAPGGKPAGRRFRSF
ncbi:Endothelial cell-specific chemotaxis regulator [Varanus komodoensis]|nr:Endothelial cell-specific chemotaxis regulator [Varanus komodoensis]